VVAALRAAANFAHLFAQADKEAKYRAAADEIVDAMRIKLYDAKLGRFVRSIRPHDSGKFETDPTVDASLFGTFYFGCFDADDELVVSTMKAVEEKLSVKGGVARFENDGYMRTSSDVTGNAWFLSSLWLAEFYIATAEKTSDLEKPLAILQQITGQARNSGVLPEQTDPATGEHTSVSPLTWSHSTYVATVESYLRRLAALT
jgi:GH15 family glucan-1,4-alpha-glucosidase